jgi:hypothetical protein
MISEAKELIDLILKLPHMALWILTGVLFYKVVIIGSWFGIARLLIERGYSILTKPREFQVLGLTLTAEVGEDLKFALLNIPTSGKYIYAADVQWLRQAIAEKREAEKKAAKEREERINARFNSKASP